MDDVTRVSEAVAKVVVFALKGASSGDNADDWLNPTEVELVHQSHIRSVTLYFLRDNTSSQCKTLQLLLLLVCFILRATNHCQLSTVQHCPHLAEGVYYQ